MLFSTFAIYIFSCFFRFIYKSIVFIIIFIVFVFGISYICMTFICDYILIEVLLSIGIRMISVIIHRRINFIITMCISTIIITVCISIIMFIICISNSIINMFIMCIMCIVVDVVECQLVDRLFRGWLDKRSWSVGVVQPPVLILGRGQVVKALSFLAQAIRIHTILLYIHQYYIILYII